MALVLADGSVRASTDADTVFSIQSAVKPFLFAGAPADRLPGRRG
nr:glutaminase [Rathayibacter rathayi]